MLSQIVIASAFAGLAAAAPVTNNFARAAESIVTFGPYNATHFRSTHFEGSCGWTNQTNQFIASVAVNASATDGALCGRTINVTSLWNGESVLAQIVDERKDVPAGYLNLSRVAFEELAPISYGYIEATYTLTGEHSTQRSSHDAHVEEPKAEEPKAEEPKAEETSTSSSHRAPASTPSSSTSSLEAEYTPKASSSSSTSSREAEYTPKSSSSSSSRREPEHTPEAEYTPKTTSSSSQWVAPTTSEKKEEYTPAYTPSTTSSRKQEAAPTPQRQSGGQSGRATWYQQNGQPGHCGNYNSDGAYIVAVSSSQFNMGLCGRGVQITNTANGRSVYATVQDSCPGCGSGSLDLSLGAFQAIGNLDSGVLPISWNWA